MPSFSNWFTAALMATSAMAMPHAKVKRTASKRGAAYDDVSLVSSLGGSSAVTWAYDWSLGSLLGNTIGLPSGVQYVPQIWGMNDLGNAGTAMTTLLASGSQYILGFNEPDMVSQANIDPTDAANAYLSSIVPFKGDAKLISPAVTSSMTPGMGLSWFESFMGVCGTGCNLTGLAVHWYGDTSDEFITFVEQAMSTASQYGLPEVWVTEFALNSDVNGIVDPNATAQDFLDVVLPWLDGQDQVTHYSYFMTAENYLITDGASNAAGQSYAAAA
ncbi:Glycoside hydrolase superfamily [Penicillium riverlandense]|uniref:Glycoside hydrolase superfamily n=1 Tax=Penicillium riverlandense TaxID=1903569 RepID=UPI00254899E1|nr:Glycoside hydrolase superfamily [Penicillium riverlandense]KAJ5815481.1 Glycoside hydrolase superfamily [Penicillium riverlandense]